MRYLIEVNTTKGWKAVAGFEVFGDAVQHLGMSDFAEVMLRDTVTGATYLYDDIDPDSAESDNLSEQDITALLDGGDFIIHIAAAA